MATEYVSETARLSTLAQQHLWMPYSSPGSQGRSADPIRVMTRGQGCTIWDSDGRAYLDGTSALEAMILGHGATEVIEAISAQARELAYLDVFRFASSPQIELAAELAAVAPGMEYVHF